MYNFYIINVLIVLTSEIFVLHCMVIQSGRFNLINYILTEVCDPQPFIYFSKLFNFLVSDLGNGKGESQCSHAGPIFTHVFHFT